MDNRGMKPENTEVRMMETGGQLPPATVPAAVG